MTKELKQVYFIRNGKETFAGRFQNNPLNQFFPICNHRTCTEIHKWFCYILDRIGSLLLFFKQLIFLLYYSRNKWSWPLRKLPFFSRWIKRKKENPGLAKLTCEPTTSSWRPASRIHFKLSCTSCHIIAVIYYFNVTEDITVQGLKKVNPLEKEKIGPVLKQLFNLIFYHRPRWRRRIVYRRSHWQRWGRYEYSFEYPQKFENQG